MDIYRVSRYADALARRIGIISIITLTVVGVLLAVVTAVSGPAYYYNWGLEFHLYTFGSALQYSVVAEIAFICFWISRYLGRNTPDAVRCPWLWLAVSFAFAFAACDEMLVWHERVPGSVTPIPGLDSLPWVNPTTCS